MTTNETSIFTKIINREILADIVYEDETVLAFLTIQPINLGHTLIVPKQQFVNIFDGDEALLGQMMAVAKKVSNALLETDLATGVNLIMNNGADAGQEVFHAHLHVIPRLENDGEKFKVPHVAYADGESSATAKLIAEQLK